MLRDEQRSCGAPGESGVARQPSIGANISEFCTPQARSPSWRGLAPPSTWSWGTRSSTSFRLQNLPRPVVGGGPAPATTRYARLAHSLAYVSAYEAFARHDESR